MIIGHERSDPIPTPPHESRVVASSWQERIARDSPPIGYVAVAGTEIAPDIAISDPGPVHEAISAGDSLISPHESIKRILDILETPDDQGRTIPRTGWLGSSPRTTGALRMEAGLVTDPETHEKVGMATRMYDADKASGFLGGVSVSPNRGYGMSVYLQAALSFLEQGADFRNDPQATSDAAVAMWHKLKDAGVATVVEEFTKVAEDENRGYYVINGNDRPKALD